jgi:hypothetical protein
MHTFTSSFAINIRSRKIICVICALFDNTLRLFCKHVDLIHRMQTDWSAINVCYKYLL